MERHHKRQGEPPFSPTEQLCSTDIRCYIKAYTCADRLNVYNLQSTMLGYLGYCRYYLGSNSLRQAQPTIGQSLLKERRFSYNTRFHLSHTVLPLPPPVTYCRSSSFVSLFQTLFYRFSLTLCFPFVILRPLLFVILFYYTDPISFFLLTIPLGLLHLLHSVYLLFLAAFLTLCPAQKNA